MGGTMLVRGPLQAHQFGTRNAFYRRETAGNVPQKNGTEFAVPPTGARAVVQGLIMMSIKTALLAFLLRLRPKADIAH